MEILILILTAAIILLNIEDIKTTKKVTSQGGNEKNPVVKWMMKVFGITPGMVIIKSVNLLPILIFANVRPSIVMALGLFGIAILYGWVVWHNYNQLK